MASAFAHAAAALALGDAMLRPGTRSRHAALVAGAFCAVLPDADVVGFAFGVEYASVYGHRGLTHSVAAALLLATAAWTALGDRRRRELGSRGLWSYLFVATLSHAVLDALTDGGLGVAFFAPFDRGRYFFPVRPIAVSPIGVGAFFTARGAAVLWSELRWVGIPALVLVVAARASRWRKPCEEQQP